MITKNKQNTTFKKVKPFKRANSNKESKKSSIIKNSSEVIGSTSGLSKNNNTIQKVRNESNKRASSKIKAFECNSSLHLGKIKFDIYLDTISPKIIRAALERFGEVEEVVITKRSTQLDSIEPNRGFIFFREARAASILLDYIVENQIWINDHEFHVTEFQINEMLKIPNAAKQDISKIRLPISKNKPRSKKEVNEIKGSTCEYDENYNLKHKPEKLIHRSHVVSASSKFGLKIGEEEKQQTMPQRLAPSINKLCFLSAQVKLGGYVNMRAPRMLRKIKKNHNENNIEKHRIADWKSNKKSLLKTL